jgi:ergothioneine biosynthesis protein EgtB
MPSLDVKGHRLLLTERYDAVRAATEALARPLSPEDQTVQSMPDASPTKWHRGHTSWFFETFLLGPALDGYVDDHPGYAYIFNSYYEAVGARHPRSERGLVSRPGVVEVGAYRAHVDRSMHALLERQCDDDVLALVELGLHHEQQHQELLLMDIKHVLSRNPLLPAYAPPTPRAGQNGAGRGPRAGPGWLEHRGGEVDVGHDGTGFAFDNEGPRHRALLTPFALADRPVTCGEWLAFMADGGYHRPELWLSDGWALSQQQGWEAPLYWAPGPPDPGGAGHGPSVDAGADWHVFTLQGPRPVDPDEPVCHVSYYEADAYAHYTGGRLPTEHEWESVASPMADGGGDGCDSDGVTLHPAMAGRAPHFGQVWEWTSSAYAPYPGFRAPAGAVGEYNGKFMVNQYVLRGGCCATPAGHTRPTYRNFFPASARWAFNGVRLARDC